MMDGGNSWWVMLWGGIMMVLFWGVIIGGIVWGIQAATRRDRHHHEEKGSRPGTSTPSEIAKERYARGEISRDEFERIIGDLEHPPPKVKV